VLSFALYAVMGRLVLCVPPLSLPGVSLTTHIGDDREAELSGDLN